MVAIIWKLGLIPEQNKESLTIYILQEMGQRRKNKKFGNLVRMSINRTERVDLKETLLCILESP